MKADGRNARIITKDGQQHFIKWNCDGSVSVFSGAREYIMHSNDVKNGLSRIKIGKELHFTRLHLVNLKNYKEYKSYAFIRGTLVVDIQFI